MKKLTARGAARGADRLFADLGAAGRAGRRRPRPSPPSAARRSRWPKWTTRRSSSRRRTSAAPSCRRRSTKRGARRSTRSSPTADGRGGEGAGHRSRGADRKGDHREDSAGVRHRRRQLVPGQPGAAAGRAARAGASSRFARYLTQERMQGVRAQLRRLAEGEDRRHGRCSTRRGRRSSSRQQPEQGAGERADRDDRVLGLPVPVLPARRSDRAAGAATPTATRSASSTATIRFPTIRTPRPAAEAAAVRQRAGQVLAVSRPAVREPAAS